MLRTLLSIALTAWIGLAQDPVPPPATPSRASNDVIPPTLLSKVEPVYPNEAKLAGLEGTVVLQIVIAPDGSPGDFKVTRSLGLGLDEAAIDCVRAWRFNPGTKEGKPVPVVATIEVNFRFINPKPWHLSRAVFKAGEGVSRPFVKKAKYPKFDDDAVGGPFTISFEVNEKGIPVNIQLEKSTGAGAENKMIEVIKDWRFSPAMKDGTPVPIPCTLEFASESASTVKRPPATASSAPAQINDPDKLAAIEKLISITMPDQTTKQILSQFEISLDHGFRAALAQQLPDSIDRSKFEEDIQVFETQVFPIVAEQFDIQKIKPQLVKLYGDAFSTEDLMGIVAFFQSPLGQTWLRNQPQFTIWGIQMGQQITDNTLPRVQQMTSAWIASMKKKYGGPPAN